MNVHFLNLEHQATFQELRSNMEEEFRFNKERLAAAFIMAGDEEVYQKMTPYFNEKTGTFSSEEMLQEQAFSSHTHVLAKLAVHLLHDHEPVVPLDLINHLDEPSFQLAMNAIILRRTGLSSDYERSEEKIYE